MATEGERSDRAWITLLKRARPNSDQLVTTCERAVDRPRVLWQANALMSQHNAALCEFFRVESLSDTDIEEFFEYIRTRVEADGDAKCVLLPYLSKLVELRPRAAAAIINDYFPESIAETLHKSATVVALEFAEYLLEMGKLKGDAAAAHLRNLCNVRPKDATIFLTKHPGVIRPEDALFIVREAKLAEAEPICLEATGDPEGALDAMLRLISSTSAKEDKGILTNSLKLIFPNQIQLLCCIYFLETEEKLIEQACELCRRAGTTVPATTGADMWTRLLRHATAAPPGLLLDAVAYLPVDELVRLISPSKYISVTPYVLIPEK